MSRMDSIRTAVAAHVTTACTNASLTAVLSADPASVENLKPDEFQTPNIHAQILFEEEPPERLNFKQQRRRVSGEIVLAIYGETVTREIVDAVIEGIRDLIFADEYLGATVDDITTEAGLTISNPDARTVFGRLDIATEEVF